MDFTGDVSKREGGCSWQSAAVLGIGLQDPVWSGGAERQKSAAPLVSWWVWLVFLQGVPSVPSGIRGCGIQLIRGHREFGRGWSEGSIGGEGSSQH